MTNILWRNSTPEKLKFYALVAQLDRASDF